MLCQFCGHNNEPNVKFCARCGAQLRDERRAAPAEQSYPQEQSYQRDRAERVGQPNQPDQQTRSSQPDQPYRSNQPDQQTRPNPPDWPERPNRPDQERTNRPDQYRPDQNRPDQERPDQERPDQERPPYRKYSQTPQTSGAARLLGSLPVKKILTYAIPVVVIIIAAIIIIPMVASGGNSQMKDHIFLVSNKGEVIVSGNNNAKFTFNGNMDSSQASLDGSKVAVLTDYRAAGGSLWLVTTSDATKIADGVHAFRIADSGNGVAYFTDYDERNDMATLYLYDVANKKETLITVNAMHYGGYGMVGVAISPNGKSIGYISNNAGASDEFTGYIVIDGKAPEELGADTLAAAISDGGKYLYYCMLDKNNWTVSLHVRSSRNESRLLSGVDSISFMLNKDYSEALFNMEGGDSRTFISKNGGERERVNGPAIQRLILPRGSQIKNNSDDDVSITVYGLRTFSDFVAVTDEGLSYYNKKLEPNGIPNSSNYANSASVSNDGKTLYFINNSNRMSSIDPTSADADRRDIDKDVRSFVASDDGKSVYYINAENKLYYAGGNSSPVEIADGVSTYLALSYSGNRVFFLMDYMSSRGGELYYSVNGGKRTKVTGADEVMSVWSTPANIFFTTRERELYRSNGNEKFSRFYDDMN